MSPEIISLLTNATLETLFMVFVASLIATVVGLPFGIILFLTRKNNFLANPFLYQSLSSIVNVTRSIPFVILMIAVIPFTRLLVGSSIGTNAAIVPLSLCAIPFLTRLTESALLEVNKGLIEAGMAMGATPLQIIQKFLIPEALPGIINALTLMIVNLVGYSAMAGAVGGGGLGDLAIRYGYQRFDVGMMIMTIIIMVVIVQLIQWTGDWFVKKLLHYR